MDPSELPFANVRQRGYTHKLEVIAGHGPVLGSTAAIALQKIVSNPSAGHVSNSSASGQSVQQSPDMQTAIDELETLKTQLSGVEAAVTLIKTYGPSVPGRRSPSHGRRAAQQLAATQSSTSPRAGPGSPNHRLQLHQQNPAVAGGKLAAPKPAAPADSPFAGAPRPSALAGHSSNPIINSTGRSSPSAAKSGYSASSGSGCGQSLNSKAQHSSMTEADMQAVTQDPINHLLRQSYNILGFPQSQQSAAAAVRPGSSTSPVPIVPVTRNEAVQLEDRLQEALPPGAIFATQQQHTAAWAKQQQRHWKQQLAVQPDVLQKYQQVLSEQQQQQPGGTWQQCDVLSAQLMPMHQAMDTFLKEAAQQVAYHCVEHGRIVDNLRERYAELANALYLSISSPNHQLTSVSAALSVAVAAATAAQRSTAKLQQQLTAKQAEADDLRSDVTTWQLKHEQLVTESQAEIQQMSIQVLDLRRQLWQLRDDRESDQLAADRAAAAASEEADAKLAAAEETNLNLRERLAFLQAQLEAVREQKKPAVATSNQESQTDPPEPPPTLEESEPPLEPETSSEHEIEQEYEQPVKKKRRKMLDLLKYAKRGQVRSQSWVVKVVGQLCADKAVSDAAADAQGQGRGGLAEFIMNWHMNRYGLRHMALEALSDLLASSCYYAAAGNRPAYWFAHFCDIAAAIPKTQQEQQQQQQQQQQEEEEDEESGEGEELQLGQLDPADLAAAADDADPQQQQQQQVLTEIHPPRSDTPSAAGPAAAKLDVELDLQLLLATPAALDFYLFCCCQLAYPNSVIALFPEGEDALPLVRSSLVMESLKAVFRYLGDPDGQALFVARKLDLAAAATSSPGAAAAADITIVRSAASASSSKGLLPGRTSPTAAAAAARSNLALGNSSSSSDQQAIRELMSKKPLNLRTAAGGGSSSGGSGRDRGGSMAGSSSGNSSSLVGGFGYYSAWTLLDLFMSEWVDRVVVNATQVADVRRTIAAMQPPLSAQLTTAAAAAAAMRPLLLSKLQETKAALDQQLKPPLEAAAAAAAAALSRSRRRRSSGDSDHQTDDSPDAAAAGSSSRAQQRRSELQPHLLVADGTMVNAAAAWGALQALVSCMQAIHERATRPQSTPGATSQAPATATPHNDFVFTPVAVETAAAISAAAQQGVVLSDALKQQLRELGLSSGASSAAAADDASSKTTAAAAAASVVSAAVMQDVLKPGGMVSALQAARAKRAAAAAAAMGASQSGGVSASGGVIS